jgi:hypothetical protein
MFEHNEKEIKGNWRKLHKKEFNNVPSSPNIKILTPREVR